MRMCLSALFFAVLALPVDATAGELKFSMRNGLVTVIATDVPLANVLTEWARIGQVKIVNGEQIFTRVTVHIVDMPEGRALDILLRSAAGYMTAQRAVAVADASAFDRIMILPTSRAPINPAPVATAPPAAFAPRPAPQPMPDVDDDPPGAVPPGAMPPGMNPQQMNPGNQPMMPGTNPQVPQGPMTSPRPGQLPQPAPQQPVPFGTPRPQPGRPGGGGPGGESGGPGAQL